MDEVQNQIDLIRGTEASLNTTQREKLERLEEELERLEEEEEEARIDELIEDIEDLESLTSDEARDLIEELRPLSVSEDVYEELEEESTFGDRMADRLSTFAGSWRFIIGFSVFMAFWIIRNGMLGTAAFDPFPFILLNLTLSTIAALQAPIILMAQNRQSEKDRAMAQNDYQVNLKSELEIADLHRKIDDLGDIIRAQSRMMNALALSRRQELEKARRPSEQPLNRREMETAGYS
jgi:uncharacterized membrane protein